MNKAVLAISLGLSACVTGGLFGTALVGRAVVTRLSQETRELGKLLPGFEVIEEKLEHGMFSSRRESKLRLGCLAVGDQVTQPLEITVRDEVSHALLLGESGIGLAAVDTQIFWSAYPLEDEPANLRAHSVFRFNGSFESSVTLGRLKSGPGLPPIELEPVTATIRGNFGGAPKSVWDAELPKLTLRAGEGSESFLLTLENLRSQGETEAAPSGLQFLRPAKGSMQIGAIAVKAQIQDSDGKALPALELRLEQVQGQSESKLTDGLLSAENRFESQFKLNTFSVDKIETQTALRRIDAKFYDAQITAMLGALFACDADAIEKQKAAAEALAQAWPKLLLHNPQFALEKLGFTLGTEHAQLGYSLGTQGVTQADLDQPELSIPDLLLAKGSAELSAELTLGFVQRALDSGINALRSAPDALQDPKLAGLASTDSSSIMAMLQLMLPAAIEAGYVVREGELLKSRATFAGGEVSVNGKPLALPSLPDLAGLLGP